MNIETPVKILVQRRAAVGDVIMSTAVVRELKRLHGYKAIIDIATDFIEVYRNNPNIRNIIPVDALPVNVHQHYDIYINLDDVYELNPVNHYMNSYMHRAFGKNDFDKTVELFANSDDRKPVDEDLKSIGDKFIVVHMRNWHWAAKNISVETWYEIYEKLFTARSDFKVVCVGGDTDLFVEGHPLFVDVRTKYNLQQLKYLMDHAACFVGIDSGPFQCAAASDTHIVGLLTHLKEERIMPYRQGKLSFNSTAIPTQEDCHGCNDNQQRPVRELICKKNNFPCAGNWDTDKIVSAILERL